MKYMSFATPGLALLLVAAGAACTRPAKCLTDNCESKVTVADSNGAVTSDAQGEVKVPPSPPVGAAPTGDLGKMAELPDLLKMQALIGSLEAKISLLDEQYLESLRLRIEGMSGVATGLSAEQAATAKLLEALNAKKAASGQKLLGLLDGFAAQLESQRLALLKTLENLEVEILDPLTPEGVAAQKRFDDHFAKLDVVRELSVKDEILKVRDEMLKTVEATYVADKGALTALVKAIIDTNLALVDANAPLMASRVLRQIIALETELQMAVGANDGPRRQELGKKLEEAQKALKMPLDAIDPKFFPELVALVTDLKVAEGTIAGLGAGIEAVNKFRTDQLQIIGSLRKSFATQRLAVATLRVVPVEVAANGLHLGHSLTVTSSVLDKLTGYFDAVNAGFAKAVEGNPKAGLPADLIAQLIEAETKLGADLKAVEGSLANLAKIASVKANCTPGPLAMQGNIPVREMQCGGAKISMIASP